MTTESKRFFFEKKKQKTFIHLGAYFSGGARTQRMKVFLVLFLQKKNCFL